MAFVDTVDLFNQVDDILRRTIDPARFINEFFLVFDVYEIWKKKMPASSREKYCMNDASKSFVCTAKVWR
ncbi:protein of unknown function [Candidatus Nitrotoga arctica]|uniref:Uncharacterized protein n=1 Tax=Candidatus Nitrotoga arctica TaxID=453162 RepID=A0ABN8ALM2_9PROT|nr:protein of unknown function [Candidatus Nitrotoga arctica]